MAVNTVSVNTYDYKDSYRYVIEDGSIKAGVQSTNGDTVHLSVKGIQFEEGCGTYENIKVSMKDISYVERNRLFHETTSIMQQFYGGEIGKDDLRQSIENYMKEFAGSSGEGENRYAADRGRNALSTLYEYFSRANVRCAVSKNQEEAEAYWVAHGVKTADMDHYCKVQGTVYYNADYYYKSEELQQFFRDTLNELADSYGVEQVDYKMIEKNTIFTPDGGLSFNGVWNWTVYNTNHYWMVVERRNSVVDNDFVPPKNFVYAFTHCVSKENVDDVVRHARIEQKDMESGKRANSRYRILHFLMEIRYGGAFSLGKHKMTDKNMKNENWGFLMPSRNNPFQNYYRMVKYEGKNSINA